MGLLFDRSKHSATAGANGWMRPSKAGYSHALLRKVITIWKLRHLVIFDINLFPANMIHCGLPLEELILIWQNFCQVELVLSSIMKVRDIKHDKVCRPVMVDLFHIPESWETNMSDSFLVRWRVVVFSCVNTKALNGIVEAGD